MSDGRRIVITDDDLPSDVPSRSVAPRAASGGPLPTVSGVRPAAMQVATPGSAWLGSTLATSVIGAAVGLLPAFAAFKLVDPTAADNPVSSTALSIGLFGLLFAAVYSAWPEATGRVWEKAAVAAALGGAIGAAAGAISAAIAAELYANIVGNIVDEVGAEYDRRLQGATTEQEVREILADFYQRAELYLARVLAWGIFGLGIGAAVGAASRSARRAVNGLIGGVIGGAVGGFIFHFVVTHLTSFPETMSQFVGLGVVALAIGAAIGLVELGRRQAWMKVIAGGMVGKEFIAYHDITNVGSSPKCQITLIKDPQIQPFHFRLENDGQRRRLVAYDGAAVTVNGVPVVRHTLRSGEAIQAGGTTLAYMERSATV